MIANANTEKLIEMLTELRELQQQLLWCLRTQQRAMRTGRMDQVQSCTSRSKFLVQQIADVEGKLRGTARQLAAGAEDPVARLSDLAAALAEPARSKLLALAAATLTLAQEIDQVNRINQQVTEEVLNCFDAIQRRLCNSDKSAVYESTGKPVMANAWRVLDAVG